MDKNVRGNGHKPAKRRKRSKWTVMVYLAGDNNLTSSCISVLQQLEAVNYEDEDVCVLACFDSNTPWPKGSRYLAINGRRRQVDNGLDWEIHNDLIPPGARAHQLITPDFCASDKFPGGRSVKHVNVAEGLRRFVDWAVTTHPRSEHYMLVLYGHGPVVAGQTFLARENPQSSLRLQDLPKILGKHFGPRQRLDILACQNCVMNGIETAYAVKDQVDYMIGSQGLVLANGWPYEKVIGALVDDSGAPVSAITEKLLKACARHMVDFSVMDRSSEQSVCDLSKLSAKENITGAISKLGKALRDSLGFKTKGTQLVLEFPVICDAVRVARLEAQTYWAENFVDIYDFCERLLKKCNEAVLTTDELLRNLGVPVNLEPQIRKTDLVRNLRRIIECCVTVLARVEEVVPHSYYIGSDLQYSHGMSIYFPWSMPVEPYSFTRKKNEYLFKPAFETYSGYDFVKKTGWDKFLKAFYGATLRKVRRAERKFSLQAPNASLSQGMVLEQITSPAEVLTTENLQKSGSDNGPADYEVWSNVKNYPRRNYVSPSDCPRRIEEAGRHPAGTRRYPNPNSPPISYLGWNICELVADVISKPLPPKRRPKDKGAPRQKLIPKRQPVTRTPARP